MANKLFNKALKILLTTNSLILLAGAMLGPIYALFVKEIGGDLLDASFASSLFALAAGVTVFILGRYSDKVKEQELIVVAGYALMGLGFLFYIFADSVIHIFLIQILIGLGEATYSPSFDALYSKHLNRKKAGSQWGAWEATNYFSIALGAILGGLVVTMFGFTVLFVIMGVACLTSALYIYLLPRKVL